MNSLLCISLIYEFLVLILILIGVITKLMFISAMAAVVLGILMCLHLSLIEENKK